MVEEKHKNNPAAAGENPKPSSPEISEKLAAITAEAEIQHQEEDIYPLREPKKDSGWAVVTTWIWIVIVLFFLAGITLLLILGIFYD